MHNGSKEKEPQNKTNFSTQPYFVFKSVCGLKTAWRANINLKAHIHPRCIARRGTVFIYENPPILFERESSEKAISDHEYSFPPARVVEETRMCRLSSDSQ